MVRLEGQRVMVARQQIKELDGLRGIAIIMVFLYHVLPRAAFIYDNASMKIIYKDLNIGWMGVDLFFVLSGFLITSSLLEMKSRERFFVNFYGKRTLRIFPLYYLSLVLIFAVFSLTDAKAIGALGNYKLFYYLFAQNWIFALSLAQVPEYMGQFWSLAIEEQFYILWPILVYKFKSKTFLLINAAIIMLVLLYRCYALYSGHIDNISFFLYFSTFTRIDTIVIGSLIALLFHSIDIRRYLLFIKCLTPALALILIVVAASHSTGVARNNPLTMTIGFTVIGLLFGCVLILALILDETSLVRSFLRSDILRFFGKYSYAIYLFHMPIIVMYISMYKKIGARGVLFWGLFFFSSLATTIVAALVSWHGLEKRFLRLKRYFEYMGRMQIPGKDGSLLSTGLIGSCAAAWQGLNAPI
jgi:peptidoglycan/LPS O-acetylase OafA/YrhL